MLILAAQHYITPHFYKYTLCSGNLFFLIRGGRVSNCCMNNETYQDKHL